MNACYASLVACLLFAWPRPSVRADGPQAEGRTQESVADAARRKTFDLILDTYVRDGFVYYRALKAERSTLDGFITLLERAQVDMLPRDERLAFWLNAYNALVLRTVINQYPIQGVSKSYPAKSIRQIPGAFERLRHRVAGRTLTLDQIEQAVLPEFHDPRVYLALGRGAVGSGRLRSEAFAPHTIEAQLADTAAECVSHLQCLHLDRDNNTLVASSIFSWRDQEFADAYAVAAPPAFASRSPIERAIIAFVEPKLLKAERDMLAKNTFRVRYQPFDWSLNDLTGRGGR